MLSRPLALGLLLGLLSWRPVPVAAQTVVVAPDPGAASAPENSAGNSVSFSVTNWGEADWFTFTCSVSGSVTGCTAPGAVFIGGWGGSAEVAVTFSAGAAGTGTVTLEAWGFDYSAYDDGWYQVSVGPPPGAPVVEAWAYADAAKKQDYGLCAAGCYAFSYAQSTVPYFSADAARSVTLVYNSDRAHPRPFVHVDVKKDPSYGQSPLKFQLQVKINGTLVTFLNGEQTLNFQHVDDGQFHRIGGQFDASAYAAGAYPMEIRVAAVFSGSVIWRTVSTVFVLVDERASPVGRGWTIGGVQRLYPQADGSALITEGDGSAHYFQWTGSAYTSPVGEFSRLRRVGSDWRRDYPDSSIAYFNAAGRMVWRSERRLPTTTFEYDGSGRLWRITDPVGYYITLSYNGPNGSLSSIQDWPGRVTYVTVQANGTLTAITDPDGRSTTFGYDGQLRLTSITDRQGSTTAVGYDPNSWKLASVTGPAVPIYQQGTVSPVATYRAWHTEGVPYQGTGTPLAPPLRDTVSGTVTDPEGHTTRYAWLNRYWQAMRIDVPDGLVLSPRYNSVNLLRAFPLPIGGYDSLDYNADGLPTYVKPAGVSSPTRLRYASGWGTPDSIWGDGQPAVRRYIGTGTGLVDSLRVPCEANPVRGCWMRYWYTAGGRVQIVKDPAGHQVTYDYSGMNGNLSTVTFPGGRTVTYGYDGYGRVISIAQTGLATRTIEYDVLNRPIRVYDGVNPNPTRYEYDVPVAGAVRVTDPMGQVYIETANALGWVVSRQDPAGRADTYDYDRDGLLRRQVTRRGYQVFFTWDQLHRLLSRGGDAIESVSFSYAADGRVVTGSTPLTVETRYLNVRGQPDSVKTHLGSWDYWRRYTYDPGSGLLDSVYATGSQPPFLSRKYAYNTQTGALTSIHLGGAATTLSLNADLLPSTVTLPGGDQVTRSFTALHEGMRISSTGAYQGVVERKLSFDGTGRIFRQLHEWAAQGHVYGYDGLGRLVADTLAQRNPGGRDCSIEGYDFGIACDYPFWQDWSVAGVSGFPYDAVGNRLPGSYYAGNRLAGYQGYTGCSYDFHWDGSVAWRDCGGQRVDLDWDAASRPVALSVNGGQTVVRLYYDAFGRLSRKEVNGAVASYFLWDGDQLLAELGPDGNKVAEYSWYPGLDQLHALVIGTTAYYGHQDGVGNVVALTDGAQNVSRTYEYDAWGQLTGGADYGGFAGRDRARFKGALWLGPEVELYYMRHRWYGPKEGRFWSEDPLGLAAGLNPYAYAGNDPVNGADPLGLCEWVGGSRSHADCEAVVVYGFIPVWPEYEPFRRRHWGLADGGIGWPQTFTWGGGARGGVGKAAAQQATPCGPVLTQAGVRKIADELFRRFNADPEKREWAANLYTSPGGRIYGVAVLPSEYTVQTPILAAWDIPLGAASFWGAMHTHPRGGRDGLLKDWGHTLGSPWRYNKIVVTLDSLFLLPAYPNLNFRSAVTEACAR